MDTAFLMLIDLAAIAVLTFAFYFPRHRRRDLVIAFLVVNVGVLAVSIVLGTTGAGIGVGLGLFGVLSIIRLRSSEIAQHEVAYYFAALALGLIAGLSSTVNLVTVGLMALLLIVVGVGDSSRLLRRYRQQVMVIDRAIPDEQQLTAYVSAMLGARVHRVTVIRMDMVNDSTEVDVRFEVPADAGRERREAGVEGSGRSRAAANAAANAAPGAAPSAGAAEPNATGMVRESAGVASGAGRAAS